MIIRAVIYATQLGIKCVMRIGACPSSQNAFELFVDLIASMTSFAVNIWCVLFGFFWKYLIVLRLYFSVDVGRGVDCRLKSTAHTLFAQRRYKTSRFDYSIAVPHFWSTTFLKYHTARAIVEKYKGIPNRKSHFLSFIHFSIEF